jgi:hypothetical protein
MEGAMREIWCGLAFAVIMTGPAPAQDHHKGFVECTRELGLQADANNPQKLSTGGQLRRWYFHNEAQQAAFSDCVARKASSGSPPVARSRRTRL